jgi:cytidylate kinase
LRDLQERDARDAERSVAPLRQAADAVALDTTGMSIESAVQTVLEQARRRGIAAARGSSE